MDRLEKAIINMLETQAITQSQMAAFQSQMSKLAERQVDSDKRWFEIRDELNQVIKILQEHTVLLQRMPQAVKEQVGFRAG